jgi:hypothetical protein
MMEVTQSTEQYIVAYFSIYGPLAVASTKAGVTLASGN